MLDFTTRRLDGRVHLAVRGQLVERTLPRLENRLAAAVQSRVKLTLDFTDCSAIDPRGTLMLVRFAEILADAGRKLRVRGLDDRHPGRDLSLTRVFLGPLVDLQEAGS
jgi:ABC-type transporter Mla MlaB component